MRILQTAAILLISLALPTHALDIKRLGYVLEIRAAQDVYLARGSLDHLKDATIAMAGLHGVTELKLCFLDKYQFDSRPHTERSTEYRIQKVGGEEDGYYRVYASDAPLPAVAAAETLEEAIQKFLEKTEPRYMIPNQKGEQDEDTEAE